MAPGGRRTFAKGWVTDGALGGADKWDEGWLASFTASSALRQPENRLRINSRRVYCLSESMIQLYAAWERISNKFVFKVCAPPPKRLVPLKYGENSIYIGIKATGLSTDMSRIYQTTAKYKT